MLQIGITNTVRFNVEIHGTGTEPTLVRLVINLLNNELGFIATKDGDKWKADVTIPNEVSEGEYDIRVEVTVNNRLFTPLKRRVPINKRTDIPEPAPFVSQITPTVPMPSIPEKEPESQLQKIVEPTLKAESKLPIIKDQPIPKKAESKLPIIKDQPIPKKVESVTKKKELVRINIAEIVADSNKRFEKVLAESPSYRKPIKPVKIVEIKTQTPVFLKKGEVIYE